jgi:hypothetical protein
MTYQVKGWDDHFESAKSRQFKTRNQVYLPNKHGLGYRRLISSKNGEAMFGAWVAMCQVLSRQSAPRAGWITDDGTQGGIPLTAGDVAMLTGYSESVVEQMLVCCASQAVAWLSVNDVKDTSGPCQGLVKDLQVPVTDSGCDSAGEGEGKGKGDGKGEGNGEGKGIHEQPEPHPQPKPPSKPMEPENHPLVILAQKIRGCRPEYARLHVSAIVQQLRHFEYDGRLGRFVDEWCTAHANALEPFNQPLKSLEKNIIEKLARVAGPVRPFGGG